MDLLMFHVMIMMFGTCFGLWCLLTLAIRMDVYCTCPLTGIPRDHYPSQIYRDHILHRSITTFHRYVILAFNEIINLSCHVL